MATPVFLKSAWINSANPADALDAAEWRRVDSAAFGGDGTPFGIRGGIVRHGTNSLAVTIDGADIITVQPGVCVIPGNGAAGSGAWRAANPTSVTIALDPRHASNPRIDRVILRQLDTDVIGTHGAKRAQIEVLTGTPAASPAVPALPVMAVELGRITVPQNGGSGSTVDNSWRTYSVAPGGILPVATAARLPGSAAIYEEAVALDTGVMHRWNGTSWVRRTEALVGTINTVGNGSSTITPLVTLTYPAWFQALLGGSRPRVQVAPMFAAAGSYVAGAQDVTTTSAQIRVRRIDGGASIPNGTIIPVDYRLDPAN